MSDEKTTSEILLSIGTHYFCNGCDDCPFYTVAEVCNTVPLNCCWMKLHGLIKRLEDEESAPD